ncbi:MAG: triose-phosphate isomerase, partial [bacterium]|nr:triose-phosphate isomerase [bacterium]
MKNNKTIIANWKMNPASLKEADILLKRIWLGQDKKLGNLDLIITPPFIYLEPLLLKAKSLRLKVKFGAQN